MGLSEYSIMSQISRNRGKEKDMEREAKIRIFRKTEWHKTAKLLLIKMNKTARIRAKPLMFRLPFNVYGAVITLKNSMK